MRRVLTLVAISALAVVLVACSGGDAGRTINVSMSDDMRYDPDRFDVNAGQTVTFEVRNHADEGHANPAALSLEAGESGSLTYTFDAAGEMLVGCHEPGHYEAGMVAPVTVHPGS